MLQTHARLISPWGAPISRLQHGSASRSTASARSRTTWRLSVVPDEYDADVLIVGAGPTGLALANALGSEGTRVLVCEQDEDVAQMPRSVSVDDEAMRFMQAVGLADAARRTVFPGTGTKYFGARGQLLTYGRGSDRPRYGHPIKNPMDHSEFQRMLLHGTARFPNVEVRHGTRVSGITQDATGATATIELDGGDEQYDGPLRDRRRRRPEHDPERERHCAMDGARSSSAGSWLTRSTTHMTSGTRCITAIPDDRGSSSSAAKGAVATSSSCMPTSTLPRLR